MRRKLKPRVEKVESYQERFENYCGKFLTISQRNAMLFLFRNAIREAQDEAELAMMRGEVRHLGEHHMLLTCVYTAISLTSRPVQREAAFKEFKQALDRYLGIELQEPAQKRRRRRLLPLLDKN